MKRISIQIRKEYSNLKTEFLSSCIGEEILSRVPCCVLVANRKPRVGPCKTEVLRSAAGTPSHIVRRESSSRTPPWLERVCFNQGKLGVDGLSNETDKTNRRFLSETNVMSLPPEKPTDTISRSLVGPKTRP